MKLRLIKIKVNFNSIQLTNYLLCYILYKIANIMNLIKKIKLIQRI